MTPRIKALTLAALGLALTPSLSGAAPITTPWIAPGGGISGSSKILGAGSSLNGKTMLDLMNQVDANQTAASSAQATANAAIPLTQKGAASGVAALDENKNVTSPLLNNVRTGGSDTGTDISAANLSSAMTGAQAASLINSSSQTAKCPLTPMGAWMNTSTNIQQMLDPSPYQSLANLHSTQFWLNSGAAQILAMGYSDMSHPITGEDGAADVTKAISIINASGQPSIEVDLNPWMMPNVPSADYDYSADGAQDSNSIFFYGSNGDATLPVTGAKVVPFYNQGLHPTTVFVNTNFHTAVQEPDTTNGLYHSAQYVTDVETAVSDIKTQMPSVKNVVIWQDAGYDDTHTSSYDAFEQFAKDPYYANDRALAKSVGAFGADIPASMMMSAANGGEFVTGRSAPYLPDEFARFWAGMFIWAKENGVAVFLFSSPFQQDATAPQYGYDTLFTKNTVALARYLAAHSDGVMNALPNFWMVGQYSPNNTSNSLGNEADNNSVTHTMLQIIEGPYSDKVNLSADFSGTIGVSISSCAVGTGYNNIPSSFVTNGIVKGFASAQSPYSGFEMNTISDNMKISNQDGMSFIDSDYLDSSLTTASPIVNIKGQYDASSKSHGLMVSNYNFSEYNDPYHLSITNGSIKSGSYNSDGSPEIDTTTSSVINDFTQTTYTGGHYNWWFVYANNQTLGAILSESGLSVPVGIDTPSLTQSITSSDGKVSQITQKAQLDSAENNVIIQTGMDGINYNDPVHSLYIGGKVLSVKSDGSPVLDTSTENYMTWGTWTNGAFDFNFSNGTSSFNAMHLLTDRADFYVPIKPQGFSKTQLIANLSSQEEGAMAYDTDDHVGVQKLCPTTTTCAWYPMQYGTALSN